MNDWKNKVIKKSIAIALITSAIALPSFADKGHSYTLQDIIQVAVAQDNGISQIHSQALSLKEAGIASATLMDPMLKVGVGGLPVDSFRFDDDPMTNISVGLSQKFARGDSLSLSRKSFDQRADVAFYQVDLRKLEIARRITALWIELRYLSQTHELTVEMKQLMTEMAAFIETNYSLGKSEAQDLLFAELQISKLDEKLHKNSQMQRRIRSQLSEWVDTSYITHLEILPGKAQNWSQLKQLKALSSHEPGEFYALLINHPRVLAAEKNIRSKETQAKISEEAYSPQFGIEVGYAYRQANGMDGQPASDLVSAYLTMDLPIFTDKRQDRNYAAAQYQVGAAKSQRDLLLKQMNAQVISLISDIQNLEERVLRYREVLLRQASNRTKATERGYENNTTQFNELIEANNDELAIAMELARLEADLHKTMNELAYSLNRYDQNVTELSDATDTQE